MQDSRVRLTAKFSVVLTILLILSVAFFPSQLLVKASASSQVAVIVDSSNSQYNNYFKIGVEKWLKWWKIDYSLIDVATTDLTQASLGDYSVIVVGQYGLSSKLSGSQLSAIETAVYNGVGLVQLDATNYNSEYLGMFGVQPIGWLSSSTEGLNFTIVDNSHFITSIYQNGTHMNSRMRISESWVPESTVAFERVSVSTGAILATLKYQGDEYPALVCKNYGSGRVVLATFATGSQQLKFGDANGFGEKPEKTTNDIHGMLLRSLIWVSQKPFVFMGMPPFMSFRIDDAAFTSGNNQQYLQDLVDGGMVVDWYYMQNGLYDLQSRWIPKLQNLYNNNQIRISPHSMTDQSFLYFDGINNVEISSETLAKYFQWIDANLTAWQLTSSSLIAPHFYKVGANAVPFLQTRGWTNVEAKNTIPPNGPLQNTWMYDEIWSQPPVIFDYADSGKTIRVLDFAPAASLYADGENPEPDFLHNLANATDVDTIIDRLMFCYNHGLSAMYPAEAMTHEDGCVKLSEAQWNYILTTVFAKLHNQYPLLMPVSMETVAYYLADRENVNLSNYHFDGSTINISFQGRTNESVSFYVFTNGKKITSYSGTLDAIQPYGNDGYLIWLPAFTNGNQVSLTLGDSDNANPQIATTNANVTSSSFNGQQFTINASPIWKHTQPKYTFSINSKNLGRPINATLNSAQVPFTYQNNIITLAVNLQSPSQIAFTWDTGPLELGISVSPLSTSIQVGQMATLTAVVSGGTVPYTITWHNTTGQVVGTGSVFTFTAQTPGVFSFYAVAVDGVGGQATSQLATITVVPPPPLHVSVTPAGASLLVGQSQPFTATVTGGMPPYSVRWINETSGAVLGTGNAYTFVAATVGTYTIHATTTDNVGNVANSTTVTINVTVVPTYYQLSISASTGGTTSPIPGVYQELSGSVVQIAALPQSGYLFDHWTLDSNNAGNASLINVTMNTNHTLTAVFIMTNPSGGGTFGYTSAGANNIGTGGGAAKVAGRFQLTEAGSVTKITAYIRGSGTAKCAIYSDSNGAPGSLIGGATQQVSVPGSGTWVDFVYSTPVNLTPGYYWLVLIYDSGGNWYYDGGGTSGWNWISYANEPSGTFGSLTSRTDLVSIYATYTTG